MAPTAAAAPPATRNTKAPGAPVRRDLLTRDPEVQARTQLDRKTVKEYAELMLDGVEFPALVVFDDGDKLYLADGWHRDAAAELAGIDALPCDVRKGTRRDAILFAVGANARHGLRLSLADRRRAVEILLRDPEWSKWSDREIARRAGSSHATVKRMRPRFGPAATSASRVARRGERTYVWAPPTAKEAAPNYFNDYLFYLVRFDVSQFLRFKQIVNQRSDRNTVAEAVDIVMRETNSAQTTPPGSQSSVAGRQ